MPARSILLLCALLCAPAAWAQSYVVSSDSAPYVPLSNPTVPALSGTADTGYVVVPLGFDFHYFGKTYTTVTVTTDGMAYFEPNPGASAHPSNVGFPSGSTPQGILAPFWDNLEGSNPFSQLGYQSDTGPHGKRLTIEWKDWNHWSGTATYSLQFQLRLHESGLIEFHYGTSTGAGQALTASIGIESPTGNVGVTARSCTPGCALADLTPDEVLSFGPAANTRDLIAGKLVVDQLSESSGTLSVQTTLEVLNFGSLSTSAEYALYLSSDTIVDSSDVLLQPAVKGPVALGPLGRVSHTTTSTVSKPAGGAWYVLAQLDPADLVAEVSETNNATSTGTPLISGVDLVATAVSSTVAAAGPGEVLVNTLSLANLGMDAAGSVGWKVLLSSDAVLDAGDHLMHSGTVALAGGQSVVQQVSYTVPSTIPSGDYWFVLQVDPSQAVQEVSETNNVVFSQVQFTSNQADLALAPFSVIGDLFVGEPFRLEIPVTNVGGATAKQFSVVVFLSDNPTLNAASDPEAGETSGLTLSPGATTTAVVEAVVPAQLPNGSPLAPGPWFLFVAAVPNGNFVEISQDNNVIKAGPLPILAPGPDLVATGLFAPPSWAPGEVVPVSRVLRNLGNRPSPAFGYRYYLSKNALVTTQDVLLPIVGADGTETTTGTALVGLGASESRVEWVRLPEGTVPAEYHLGVFVDPADAVVEIREDNNGFAGVPVTVEPSRLQLAAQGVPDAVVGRPWAFQLSAIGAQGSVTWDIRPTAAGALPPEVTFDPTSGRLQGTPATIGIYPFEVTATDASGARVSAVWVLRVVPEAGAVSITTSTIRAATLDRPYFLAFGAQGGQAPYRWSLASGALPLGVRLTEQGALEGVPEGSVGTESAFTVRVVDVVGNAAQATFTFRIVAPGELTIDAPAVPQAQVGTAFGIDLVARRAEGEGVAGPLQWEVVSGRLPNGLGLEAAGDAVRILRGVPTEAGTFPVGIQVTDAEDRQHTVDVVIDVHRLLRRIEFSAPEAVRPGMEVSGALTFEGGTPGRFKLRSGRLPPGVSLASEGGVSGTIPEDAAHQLYTFTVAGVAQDGAEGWASFSIDVTDHLPGAASGCGCATSSGSAGIPVWALTCLMALGAWASAGRRRRSPRSRR